MAYILPDARASYQHWWTRQVQTYALWFAYRHLNLPELGYYPRIPRHRYQYPRWIRPWDISTSGESSFRQNGYEKKTKDQAKADWRERKGFKRDKAKCGYHRYSNAGPYGKRMVHRARRQHEREMIAHERYDEISQGVQDIVRCWWD